MIKEHEHLIYNELQAETAKYIDSDCNLVVMAPTSSGKTIVAEQFIFPTIKQGHRAIYLSPLKALTQEKLEAWEVLPCSVVAITSDHMRKPRPIKEDLVLMTTEALDSRSRGSQQWLKKARVLVVDEAHLLSSPGRGDATEMGLVRFSKFNPDAQIIFLSATITNADELGQWLYTLNGKHTEVVKTDWRPVQQSHHFVQSLSREWDFDKKAIETAKTVIARYPEKQVLVFVHTIWKGHKLSRELACPFHYSRKSKEDRAKLEEAFRQKDIMCMVSTSTLAYGLNLPADIGVIVGGHRGPVMVEAQDIKQMAGRIGRYGLSEHGIVYYVFREDYFDYMQAQLSNIPPIRSVLHKRLHFHIVSFVAREKMQLQQIRETVKRTLFATQKSNVDQIVEEAIDLLQQYKILSPDEPLLASNVGRAAALMYIDPLDLWHLDRNLASQPQSPKLIAKAFAQLPRYEINTYVPDLEDPIILPYGMQTMMATAMRDWLEGKRLEPNLESILRPYLYDIERWTSALKIAGLQKDYMDSIAMMIVNGVPRELVDLVSVPGIGRKRAIKLVQQGIHTRDDILANEGLTKNVLGAKTFQKVKMHLQLKEGKLAFIF